MKKKPFPVFLTKEEVDELKYFCIRKGIAFKELQPMLLAKFLEENRARYGVCKTLGRPKTEFSEEEIGDIKRKAELYGVDSLSIGEKHALIVDGLKKED